MPLFQDRPELFRDKDPLERDYLPDAFENRQNELNEYKDALYPVFKGESPKNIFIHGEAGTGKTSLTKFVLEHLTIDAQNQGVMVTTIYVNCNDLNNSYQLARSLTNALREQRNGHTRHNLPKKGYSMADVFEFLFEELDRVDGTILLVLDELNNIDDQDILYELPRARSNQRIDPDTKPPGIIGISNEIGYLETLEPKVEDSLNQESIRFSPYNATELQNILKSRATEAFYDDVLDLDVIPLCAAKAAQESGSARRALRLLRTAGEIARNDQVKNVTIKNVEAAERKLDKDLVKETIGDVTLQTKHALLTVALAACKQHIPARTSELYSTYEDITATTDAYTLGHDRFRQRLDTLYEQNVITRQKKNDDGQYSEYSLNKDLSVILDTLGKTPDLIDYPRKCAYLAQKNRVLTDEELASVSFDSEPA